MKLLDRENIQSTAVGNGVAIPHCFSEEIHDLVIIVALSPGGVDLDSLDGKRTQVVLLLLGNRRDYSLHLKAFARIARLIKSATFLERLLCSTSAQDMMRAFEEEEAKIR